MSRAASSSSARADSTTPWSLLDNLLMRCEKRIRLARSVQSRCRVIHRVSKSRFHRAPRPVSIGQPSPGERP